MERPNLPGQRLLLRATAPADREAFAAALAHPAVARYWPDFDDARIRSELIDEDEGVVVFAIEHEGATIGAIQYSEEDDPMYRHAGVDLFLDPRWHGRGLGREAIRVLLRYLFEVRGHHRAVIDPAQDNVQAIRTYEQVGFRRVGVMRAYERGADGSWHDGLLMELLADELVLEEPPPG